MFKVENGRLGGSGSGAGAGAGAGAGLGAAGGGDADAPLASPPPNSGMMGSSDLIWRHWTIVRPLPA